MIVKTNYTYFRNYFDNPYLKIKIKVYLPKRIFPIKKILEVGYRNFKEDNKTHENTTIEALEWIQDFLENKDNLKEKFIKKQVFKMLKEEKYFDKISRMENEILKIDKNKPRKDVFEFKEEDFEEELCK